ncbi:MAG: VWA domain-containing protein [Desulfatitalea sp.]
MAGRPKPLFWFTVLIVVAGLVVFALNRAGILSGPEKIADVADTAKAKPSQVMTIQFYTSSAKKSWIDAMAREFNAAQHEVEGQVVQIKAIHGNSGEQLEQLKEGKIRPDIWSPGDESWLQMGASHWKNVKQKELYERYSPLVNIPLVIAMWEPMAVALGYPRPIGWQDIAKVANNPKGWAAHGHPEWGKFRWGHAHPDANSGFLSVVSEVYAVLDKTDGITPQDLKNPKVVSFLKSFEGAVEHYGLSNSWIDDLMHVKGPAYLSCAVQYENTIIESNEKYKNKPFKLVAVYPAEGNFWTQHPAAVINEEWVTPDKAAAAKQFIDFLLGREAQAKAMQLGLRPILKDLPLQAPFDEIHGVQAQPDAIKAFAVPSEDVLKRIIDLWQEVKIPATVALVLDRSGSMKGMPMDSAKSGAIEFIKHMKARDQVLVTIFNNEVTTLSDLCAIRDCGERTTSQLDGIFAEGGTALHDVILATFQRIKALKQKEPNRRYSILVLSDGKDTSSTTNRNDFLDSLPTGEDFDVPKIFTIAYGNEADKDLLAQIANSTNARLFSSSPEEIAKTYKELSANF